MREDAAKMAAARGVSPGRPGFRGSVAPAARARHEHRLYERSTDYVTTTEINIDGPGIRSGTQSPAPHPSSIHY